MAPGEHLRVAAFTGGLTVSSARYRVRQYVSSLKDSGIALTEHYPAAGSYPPARKLLRPLWGFATLAERFPAVLRSYQCDVSLFQREMLSTLVTWEPFTKKPRVLDVDDAIFLFRGGATARRLASLCDSVICGNAFLAEHFAQWNRHVIVVPTGVDTERFRPRSGDAPKPLVIGWSGGRSGMSELYEIEDALAEVLNRHPRAALRVICDSPPRFRRIPPHRVEYLPWSMKTEVRGIQEMSVGLMPLADTLWNRGKCSYKMLLSMSCGVPVVVSPVGMNAEVLRLGECGVGATTPGEWVRGLDMLLSDPQEAARRGRIGRDIVQQRFAIASIAPCLAGEFLRVAGKSAHLPAAPAQSSH